MALAIDTLAYARRLREAGFSEKQAESQAEALAAAMTDTLANKQDLQALATKQDLVSMSAALADRIDPVHRELEALRHGTELRLERVDGRFAQTDARIDGLEHRMEARFQELDRRLDLRLAEQTANFHGHLADLERRMTMRLGGITVAGIGVVSAFVKLL